MIREKDVLRDKSGAIISVRYDQLNEYRQRKEKLREKDKRINDLESRLSNIENILQRISSGQISN